MVAAAAAAAAVDEVGKDGDAQPHNPVVAAAAVRSLEPKLTNEMTQQKMMGTGKKKQLVIVVALALVAAVVHSLLL